MEDMVKGDCGEGNCQSLDSYKEETCTPVSTNGKDQHNTLNGHAIWKLKDEHDQAEEVNMSIPPVVNGHSNSSIDVEY